MSYPHIEIEKKWQKKWQEAECFKASDQSEKPKFYALGMFPYPSGAGLHVGHLASYTPPEIIARYKRAQGYNVLHPMGYDAFGLPAEQFAIQTGIHPRETTNKAIDNFRRQLQSFGYSFDWSREISTCEPDYYKWTQFIFLKLFEKGLAYQKEVPVNWCPALKTVLANEEVVDGKSERGGHPVIRKPMKQWMLKITDYAERLLADLDQLDWPERTKEGQRNWIGKSEGASLKFALEGASEQIEVFTTRPDTLFGATFLVLAPEHPLVSKVTTQNQLARVNEYKAQAASKSELDRKAATEKTGVFTGGFAIHPITGASVPVWIADYVLMDYGTGAIMAVPGHDERDFEFAQKYQLPIKRIIENSEPLPATGDGILCDSDFLNGLSTQEAKSQMLGYLEQNNLGERKVQYKLRDWLFSRQRYWGEPFPILESESSQELMGVPIDELPVLLPSVADYEPTEDGKPPLARIDEFVNYPKKINDQSWKRNTDTMPGSAGSSWYFLRYIDPHNADAPFDHDKQKYWMPVDLYVGGPEHTVGHLLYSRFWQKVLYDVGLVSHPEPFQRLAHQGDILGPDGQRMSKSRGNVVNPDEVRDQFGADAVRLYVCFMGPFDKGKPWNSQGIEGVRRFLDRLWRLVFDENNRVIATDVAVSEQLNKTLHKTIKKVTEDIESMGFNTAISAMMVLVNELYNEKVRPKSILKTLSQLLMPLAPHIAEEIWSALGGEGFVSLAKWPAFDEALCQDDLIELGVQVNGKMRGTISGPPDLEETPAVNMALEIVAVKNAIGEGKVVKVIYKAGKILNLIVKN